MRARIVGRTGRMDNGKLLRRPEFFKRFKRRVKAEKAIEVDCSVRFIRCRNGDRRAEIVILTFTVRHNDIQPIDRTALEYSHQNLLFAIAVFRIRRLCKLMQEVRCGRHKTKARQTDAARFQKKSSIHLMLTSCSILPPVEPPTLVRRPPPLNGHFFIF